MTRGRTLALRFPRRPVRWRFWAGVVAGLALPALGRAAAFEVLHAENATAGEVLYTLVAVPGAELPGHSGNARRRVPARDQLDFADPEADCGPVAMLNWLLWLGQERKLELPPADPPAGLDQDLYGRIKTVLEELRGEVDTQPEAGVTAAEMALVMDRLADTFSAGRLRFQFQMMEAPLKVSRLFQFTEGFRCGILISRVVEEDGKPGEFHAVNLIAVDRRGGVMINNWGEQVFGYLRNEPEGQFFRAENTDHPALKIESAICLVPFQPAGAVAAGF